MVKNEADSFLGIVVLTALLSVSGTYLIMKKKNYDNETFKNVESELDSSQSISKENDKKEFESTVDTSGLGWENTTYSKRIDEWKSGDEPFVGNLVEEVLQEMAHQKIIAESKESSIMITPERINILLQMVEENKDKYEGRATAKHAPYETYLDILNRWKKGDFSTVNDDHNFLMIMQGGKSPEGLATGIATKEQEQEQDYIFRVFGIPVKKQN